MKERNEEYRIKESLSNEIHSIETNGWNGKPQTIEEYNKELEEAVAEVKAGKYYSHEEVKEMAKNW